MTRASAVGLGFGLLVVGFVVWSSINQGKVSCEVCVSYRGNSKCRTASGPSEMDTIRAATDNACSFLASGMTENIQCGRVRPDRVDCTKK